MTIDLIDQKLLEVLQEDATVSISEISKRINLSISAVSERVKKLEQSGVITRYTTILDPEMMGRGLASVIMVSVDNPAGAKDFAKLIAEDADILSCVRISGNYDYLIKAATKDQAGLEACLNRLKAVRGVTRVSSCLVLSELKMNYSVPPVAGK